MIQHFSIFSIINLDTTLSNDEPEPALPEPDSSQSAMINRSQNALQKPKKPSVINFNSFLISFKN
jgi:hypothetical protein